MKTVGLITEYNPFHNGHLHHLEQAKEQTGADRVVVVMSGNFVQRGAPALFDKYLRTSMALRAGADLVLEIPAAFATGSAKEFASCAVSLLDRIGVTDSLCFGSELGEIEPLAHTARFLFQETESFSQVLKEGLKQGFTFPDARRRAVKTVLEKTQLPENNSQESVHPLDALLSSPNNILGIEYLLALEKRNSRILPLTIKRFGKGYHDTTVDSSACASATAIRSIILNDHRTPSSVSEQIQAQIPPCVLPIMKKGYPIGTDSLSLLLNYRLLSHREGRHSLKDYADMTEDLEDRLSRQALDFASFDERVSQLKTRQYTYTRISRALLHLILGITKEQMLEFKELDYAPYARVLGFKKCSADLLKAIKKEGEIPLITKPSDALKTLTPGAASMLRLDLHCAHIYQSFVWEKYKSAVFSEYENPLVRL